MKEKVIKFIICFAEGFFMALPIAIIAFFYGAELDEYNRRIEQLEKLQKGSEVECLNLSSHCLNSLDLVQVQLV